jgi:putative DNA topoisomerase
MKKFMIICAVLLTATTTFAQKAKGNNQRKDKSTTFVTYTCPMHPDVKMKKPGKCSKCGMNLTVSKKEEMKLKETTVYSCPMHTEVISDTAGTCPKCGISLTASKKEQMKWKEVNGYKCPMHPDEISGKPGKCPKCGMELTKKN